MKVRIYRHRTESKGRRDYAGMADVIPYRNGVPEPGDGYGSKLEDWERMAGIRCFDAEVAADDYRLLERFHWHPDDDMVGGGYYLWDEVKHLFGEGAE